LFAGNEGFFTANAGLFDGHGAGGAAFVRLLVAQALVEDLTLVSADPHVLAYDVKSIDARR
jgi:hypothetical protein